MYFFLNCIRTVLELSEIQQIFGHFRDKCPISVIRVVSDTLYLKGVSELSEQ